MHIKTIIFKWLCLISFCISATISLAQPTGKIDNILIPKHIKTQKQLAKYQAKKFLLTKWPKKLISCAKHVLGLDPFYNLLQLGGEAFYQKVFKFHNKRRTPQSRHQFAFDNGQVSTVCSRDFGFCRGYSTALTRWNRLAHFDDANFLKEIIPNKYQAPEEWFLFYKKKIDQLMLERKAIVVPGFKNLYEFSASDPKITNYLKEHIALMWAKKNINISAIKILKSINKRFHKQEAIKLHRDLKYQIQELHTNPILWVSTNTPNKWYKATDEAYIHVMQAYDISAINKQGEFTISLWDIYTPHRAELATVEVTISTRTGKTRSKSLKKSGAKGKNKDVVYTDYDGGAVSEIEQLPFDKMDIGEDALSLLKFYNENPRFYNYLVKKLKNPQPEEKLRYVGEKLPPVILKDGTYWQWPEDWIQLTGDIKLPKKADIPDNVLQILKERLGVWPPKNNEINPFQLQVPSTIYYGDELFWKWPVEWVDHSGFVKIPKGKETEIPKEVQEILKKNLLFWPPKKSFHANDIGSFQYRYHSSDSIDWNWPREWIQADGTVNIPSHQVKHLPDNVHQEIIDDLGKIPQESFNPQYLQKESRTIDLEHIGEGEKWTLPLESITGDNKIDFSKIADKNVPQAVKNLVGFWPPKRPLDIDAVIYNRVFELENGGSWSIPLDWMKVEEYSKIVTIPKNQAHLVPKEVRQLIVGNAAWPPKESFPLFGADSIVLKDGSYWDWPLSWVDDYGTIHFPEGGQDFIPQVVRREIFSKGPWTWPPEKTLDSYRLQFPEQYLDDGSLWLWPIEWMSMEGEIRIPKGEEKSIPKEVQDIIKENTGEWPPKNRIVREEDFYEVWEEL